MGILLLIIAIVLFVVLAPLGLLFNLFYYFYKRKFFKAFKEVNTDMFYIALSIDQLGNTVFKHLFNWALRKKDGYRFGNPDETISGVLGKNKLIGTLTTTGKVLDWILNKIDKNHSINSIEADEN